MDIMNTLECRMHQCSEVMLQSHAVWLPARYFLLLAGLQLARRLAENDTADTYERRVFLVCIVCLFQVRFKDC